MPLPGQAFLLPLTRGFPVTAVLTFSEWNHTGCSLLMFIPVVFLAAELYPLYGYTTDCVSFPRAFLAWAMMNRVVITCVCTSL